MQIAIENTPLTQTECDLLVVAVTTENQAERLADLDAAFDGQLLSTLGADEFKAKAGASASYPTFGAISASRLVVVGLGDGGIGGLQQAAGKAGTLARQRGTGTVALSLGDLDDTQTQLAIESFVAGTYRFDKYKADDARKADVAKLTLLDAASADGVSRGEAVAAGQSLARDLVNEPADAIYPQTLADVAQGLTAGRLTVEVWDDEKIEAHGMGGIMGVGRGSDRKPRFIHVHACRHTTEAHRSRWEGCA